MTRPLRPWIALPALVLLAGGCASTTSQQDPSRRGPESTMLAGPAFGVPRGRQFEDIVPVGSRITAVHVRREEGIIAIWLDYERSDLKYSTPARGGTRGKHEVFSLKAGERIISMTGTGKTSIESIVIVTDKRTKILGAPEAQAPQLTEEQRTRHTGIGISGRADTDLRQLSLRIQVR